VSKSKYRNQKVTVGTQNFDSKAEARRYGELVVLQRAGMISELKLQEKFTLIGKQKGERAASYIADFTYRERGELVVEDVKGMKTREYVLKRKLMLFVHNIRIREIY
jgi:hypothetical protein